MYGYGDISRRRRMGGGTSHAVAGARKTPTWCSRWAFVGAAGRATLHAAADKRAVQRRRIVQEVLLGGAERQEQGAGKGRQASAGRGNHFVDAVAIDIQ